jgi:hypothetical protein
VNLDHRYRMQSRGVRARMKSILPPVPEKIAMNALVWTVVAFAAFSCGCREKQVSLEYDSLPENLVVDMRTGGGLPTPWVDGISQFRLYGDGRVVERPGGDERKPVAEGRLTPAEVRTLLENIRDTGFFGLKSEYANRKIMDGTTQRISVNLKGGKKEVRVYMKDVKEFDAAADAIMGYPLRDAREYVPGKGYLLVQKSSEAPTDQLAPTELAALLPSAAELLGAAETGKPIEITGDALVSIMDYESAQKYRGLVVKVEGGQLTVYPLYEPVVR